LKGTQRLGQLAKHYFKEEEEEEEEELHKK
jgi:hypothetical protein